MRDRRSFWPEDRGPAAHTVATALAGEPTAPGRRKGGAVSRKRERPLARSQSARSESSQISPRYTPSLNRQCACSGSEAQWSSPSHGRDGEASTARLSEIRATTPDLVIQLRM